MSDVTTTDPSTTTPRPAGPGTDPSRTDDTGGRGGVVVLCGNPRPGSRTLAAAQTAAQVLVDDLGLPDDVASVDLADLAPEVFAASRPRVDDALALAASAHLLVVATPVYKASYTGLLKSFVDLYGPDGLRDVVVVPLVVSGAPHHALAGETHLRPLLVELGATVPARSLTLVEAQLTDVEGATRGWLAHAAGPLTRALAAPVTVG